MILNWNVDFGIEQRLGLSFRGHGSFISGLSFGLSGFLLLFKEGCFNSFWSDRLPIGVDSVFEGVFFGRVFGNIQWRWEILSKHVSICG